MTALLVNAATQSLMVERYKNVNMRCMKPTQPLGWRRLHSRPDKPTRRYSMQPCVRVLCVSVYTRALVCVHACM